MSSFNLSRTMTAGQRRALKTMAPSIQNKTIWGENFRITAYEVNGRTYKKLGLRSSVFAPGVQLFVMDRDNFDRFCRRANDHAPASAAETGQSNRNILEIYPKPGAEAGRLSQNIARAMYPLSLAGELDAVREERLGALSDRSRTIVLRDDFTALELKHELLHDLFLGPTYSIEMRRNIIRLIAFYVKWAYKAENQAAIKFFEGVNKRCGNEYDLLTLTHLDILPPTDPMKVGPNLFNYGGEAFVYAWELLLGHSDPALGEVPVELKALLNIYSVRP